MKKLTTILLLIGLAAMPVFLSSCDEKAGANTSDELKQNVPKVKVELAALKSIQETISFTGNIEPYESVNLTPDLPGRIIKINVKEGDHIKKGKLIAMLDTKAANLQLEQAKAAMGLAEANLKTTTQTYNRMKELHESKSISLDQWEKVELGFEVANKQLEQAKAAVHLAEYQIQISSISAPFAGVITYKGVSEQEHISPLMMSMGPNPVTVVTLTDISKVYVIGYVSEADVVRLKEKMKAIVTIDSLPDKEFNGEVSFINSIADIMSHTFKVKILLDNEKEILKGGMYARINVVTNANKDAVVVPRAAIISDVAGEKVFVAEKAGIVKKVKVKTGIHSNGFIEILEGVKAGDKIIVDGNFGLRDGVKVEILD